MHKNKTSLPPSSLILQYTVCTIRLHYTHTHTLSVCVCVSWQQPSISQGTQDGLSTSDERRPMFLQNRSLKGEFEPSNGVIIPQQLHRPTGSPLLLYCRCQVWTSPNASPVGLNHDYYSHSVTAAFVRNVQFDTLDSDINLVDVFWMSLMAVWLHKQTTWTITALMCEQEFNENGSLFSGWII